MYEVTQVRIRELGKTLFFNARGIRFSPGDYVIVEADRGLDYGQVVSDPILIEDKAVDSPLKAIVKGADEKDIEKIKRNREKAKESFVTCSRKIEERNISMKLVEAEYSFDQSKVTFYFTSEGRVDFRELVKELASIFKARIELRQIGVRDEAKMLGGIGHCGQALCCARFLKDFVPVTIRMAKDQNLSLNPTKISGACGRLMCCLGYEYTNYKDIVKRLPREGEKILLTEGKGRVRSIDILKETLQIELEDGRIVPHVCKGCHCSKRSQEKQQGGRSSRRNSPEGGDRGKDAGGHRSEQKPGKDNNESK